MTRLLLLLSCCCLIQGLEIEIELPNPSIVNAPMRGRINLINYELAQLSYQIAESDDVELIINTNDLRRSSSFGGGHSSNVLSFGLQATFKREGQISLPTITFTSDDGKTFTSKPTVITVDHPRSDLSGDVVCTVTLDPPSIVPGETCKLIYEIALNHGQGKAWTVNNVGGANLPPDAIELGETEQKQGNAFDSSGNKWVIVNFVRPFTMTTPGEYRIGSQQRYGFEDRFFRQFKPAGTVPVKPATLTVVPLPTAGRPTDFSNLVGEVNIESKLDRDRISLGEGAQLVVTVEGTRVELLSDLELPVINGLRTYQRDKDQDAQTDTKRVFRWDLVPEAAGSYDIPTLSLPWFDPATRSYQRARSKPLLLNVIPGRQRNLQVVGGLQPVGDREDHVVAKQGLSEPIGPERVVAIKPMLFLFAGLGGMLVSALTALFIRAQMRGPRQIGAAERSRRALATGNLAAANQALSELAAKQHDPEQRKRATTLLQAVESARFGKADNTDELCRQAKELRDP